MRASLNSDLFIKTLVTVMKRCLLHNAQAELFMTSDVKICSEFPINYVEELYYETLQTNINIFPSVSALKATSVR